MRGSSPSALSPGVRLICGGGIARGADCRIKLSSGITPGSIQYPAIPYLARAFVPRLPWRPPTGRERADLMGSIDEIRSGGWVAIVRAPQHILVPFEDLRAASSTMRIRADLQRHLAAADYQRAIAHALEFIATFAAPGEALDGVGIFGNAPGMSTTTPADESCLNGLHVDNFYSAPLRHRDRSPGRFAINLGLSDRFFLYVNQPIAEIARMLGERHTPFSLRSRATIPLRTSFMTEFPEYPVVKLRLRPGEAYIAPTENIIHDACTIGQTSLDLRISVRGHFCLRRDQLSDVG